MLTVRRFATTAITGITRMIARLTATTVLDGSMAVCSWALARGMDGAMDVASDMDAAGVMVAAATVTDAADMDTADGLDTAMAVALDMVRGPVMPVERGLGTVAAHGLAVTAVGRELPAVVDSTAAVAAASTAVAVDMAAADTGKLFA